MILGIQESAWTSPIVLTPEFIAEYTGRRLWAVHQQMAAIGRRMERGERTNTLLRRALRPLAQRWVRS